MAHDVFSPEISQPLDGETLEEGLTANPADADLIQQIRKVGLRPTRQRLALGKLLFQRGGDRHVTAEQLHGEAFKLGIRVSVATVYNTLHQFTEVGLLREVVVDAGRCYFDTNIREHFHFFFEDEARLLDVEAPSKDSVLTVFQNFPEVPEGTYVDRVDVVIRLKRT